MDTNTAPSSRIKLDIGGTIFAITRSKLLKGDTFFTAMFAGRFNIKQEDDGSYFIDRDPLVFRHILNFLRGQEIELRKLNEDEIQLLIEDADYYQLEELKDKVLSYTAFENCRIGEEPTFHNSENGRVVTKVSKVKAWDTTVSTTGPFMSNFTWKLKVSRCVYGSIMIGYVPSFAEVNKRSVFTQFGTFLYGSGKGFFFSDANSKIETPQTMGFENGSTVELKYDPTDKSVSWFVDGKANGKTITTADEIYGCVLLYNFLDCVEIEDTHVVQGMEEDKKKAEEVKPVEEEKKEV